MSAGHDGGLQHRGAPRFLVVERKERREKEERERTSVAVGRAVGECGGGRRPSPSSGDVSGDLNFQWEPHFKKFTSSDSRLPLGIV